MKTLGEIKDILRSQKPYLAEKYGVIDVGLFGSYIRNEQNKDSDIDILVDLGEPLQIDLMDLVNLERYLNELLGHQVDVAIKSSLRKRIGKRILEEVVPL